MSQTETATEARKRAPTFDGLLTREQLARQLGLTKRTLDRWGRERIGPPKIKIGHAVYYRPENVRTWLPQHEQQPRIGRGRRIARAQRRAG
jgi:predicted DNA-binding transcriptional regulator AlpA